MNVNHHGYSIHHRMTQRFIRILGGFREKIEKWITGLVVCPDHENANVECKATASIQQNGVTAMQIELVRTILNMTKQ